MNKAKAQGFALGVAFALKNKNRPDFRELYKTIFNHLKTF